MPSVTNFSHLGHFPYCVDEVEVSGFGKWVTLGGTQKGSSPSQAEIDLSLENARKLCWDLYAVTGRAWASNGVSETVEVLTANVDNATSSTFTGDGTPKPRVCDKTSTTLYGVTTADSYSGGGETLYADLAWAFNIVKMLDGGEFVGYGIRGGVGAEADYDLGGGFAESSSISLVSYGTADFSYTTLSGIDFLELVSETNPGDPLLDASITALEFYTYT